MTYSSCGGNTFSRIKVEDAGVFCSRTCLKDFLRSGDKSGMFDLRKPMT